ncbi:hypothetical protein ABW19_dt0201066 [Dactylella cylindrospora]|nr:hypothetical protein ABW19_dt0201066 [Dactylella cylindrospora]
MIIPIRCFSCGKVVGDLWEPYMKLLEEGTNEGSARPPDALRSARDTSSSSC